MNPASERGFKTPKVEQFATTKAEHDALVERRGRSFTDEPLGHYSSARVKAAAPQLEDLAVFGVHIKGAA